MDSWAGVKTAASGVAPDFPAAADFRHLEERARTCNKGKCNASSKANVTTSAFAQNFSLLDFKASLFLLKKNKERERKMKHLNQLLIGQSSCSPTCENFPPKPLWPAGWCHHGGSHRPSVRLAGLQRLEAEESKSDVHFHQWGTFTLWSNSTGPQGSSGASNH